MQWTIASYRALGPYGRGEAEHLVGSNSDFSHDPAPWTSVYVPGKEGGGFSKNRKDHLTKTPIRPWRHNSIP